MSFVHLFLIFMKFGILCVGGGYMLVPFLTAELVDGYGVMTAEEFRNLFSIAQVTPGPIGINAATYVGYTQFGVAGAVGMSVALVLPSLVLTTAAVYTLKRYEHHWSVQGFLAGVRPATVGLIAGTMLIFMEMSIFTGPAAWPPPGINWGAAAVAVIAAVVQFKTKLTLTWLILGSAALGALIC